MQGQGRLGLGGCRDKAAAQMEHLRVNGEGAVQAIQLKNILVGKDVE